MYSDWSSIQSEIQTETGHKSVLAQFPSSVGREVSNAIVHSLASSLVRSNESGDASPLATDTEVQWTMQIICYGLSLPLSDIDTIKDCVNIYCEWLTCVLPEPKRCVPKPILEAPNEYASSMLCHLHNVFVPRLDGAADLISKQAVFCHRVLRTVQSCAEKSTVINNQLWDCLLRFLLSINDALLSPPAEKDSIGTQLCERVLAVLFDIWIIACARCFPAPSLWKTLQEMCCTWRHHEALVTQWHRVNVAFTIRLLRNLYGSASRITVTPGDDEVNLLMDSMDSDRIIQCWFRFLHTLGNPVDLSRPHVIGSTQQFLHATLTGDIAMPYHIDCLRHLPTIFHRAMRSVAILVDAFLGINHVLDSDWLFNSSTTRQPEQVTPLATVTPPSHRRPRGPSILIPHLPKAAKDLAPRPSVSDSSNASVPAAVAPATTGSDANITSLSPCRPTVNSLLHLLGSWLLEASLVGVRVHGSESKSKTPLRGRTASLHVVDSDPARLQSHLEHSLTDSTGSAGGNFGFESENYEAGRAQACGALCRIFCSHKTGEKVLPVYTARFYVALYYALHIDSETSGIPTVLASVIINSQDLWRVDVDGIHVILPRLLNALEELQPRFKYKNEEEDIELRRSSVHLLLSMICLPLSFGSTAIKAILDDTKNKSSMTFISLKKSMSDLLLQFLTVETDLVNTHMLLGGLVVCVLDQALWERFQNDQSQTEQYSGTELFDKAISLVCNRLMVSWKSDLCSALAAMEVLSALARVRLIEPSRAMCKRAVNWICEFVAYQCSRPPQYHSKDMHSTIVAAYQCLSTWLLEHDYLLHDLECLQTVLQVVELGISGSKSQSKPSETPQMKSQKLQPRPVSKRVCDAAEALLTTIIDYVGCFPPPCGPESLCSLLDEESPTKLCNSAMPERGRIFQYYVIDSATIIGLLDEQLGNSDEHLPTVTAVVRGAFGRHCWTMQLRHQPQSQKLQRSIDTIAEDQNTATKTDQQKSVPRGHHQWFPDIVQSIPSVLADQSIPRLESTMSEYQTELQQLAILVANQVQLEQMAHQNFAKTARLPAKCVEPVKCKDFQTARLFLSHYGLLNLDGLKAGTLNSMPPSLAKFKVEDPEELWKDLQQLDALPVRTADTVTVFYVKAGQSKLADILQNVCQKQNVQPHFLELLRSLGWPVDVLEHCGWTGSIATSWKNQSDTCDEKAYLADTGGSLYDGQQQVLYWADASSEVVFIVPSPTSHALAAVDKALPHTMSTDASLGSLILDASINSHAGRLKSVSLDFENLLPSEMPSSYSDAAGSASSRLRRSGRAGSSILTADVQVMVVWLESFEDYLTFPVSDLTKSVSSDVKVTSGSSAMGSSRTMLPPQVCLIFIHPLQNGLFRIRLQAQQTRISEAGPLVDGMVISRRLLGHLVRQTAVNIFKRRYLDTDPYQPPHARRKLKIKDIVEKYHCRLAEPDFYTSMFHVPTNWNVQS